MSFISLLILCLGVHGIGTLNHGYCYIANVWLIPSPEVFISFVYLYRVCSLGRLHLRLVFEIMEWKVEMIL